MARTKQQPMTDQEVGVLVEQEARNSMGFFTGDVSADRSEAIYAYEGEFYGDEEDGRSKFIDRTVLHTVESLMPEMMRIFFSTPHLIEYQPVSEEDVSDAEQASDYINHSFMNQWDGYLTVYNWVKNGLIEKNGVVMCYWDDAEEVTTKNYDELSEDQLRVLLANPEYELNDEPEAYNAIVAQTQDPFTGDVVSMQETFYRASFTRTQNRGKIRIENVPSEEMLISRDTLRCGFEDSRMVGRYFHRTRSQLIEMGFDPDIIDTLPADEAEGIRTTDEVEQARRRHSDEWWPHQRSSDRTQDRIVIIDAYIRADRNRDGVSELLHVIKAGAEGQGGGGTVLLVEEVDRQPFHVWSPIMRPHLYFGWSVADLVVPTQRQRTQLVRAIQDNLSQVNRPRKKVVAGWVDWETVQNTDLGAIDLIKNVSDPGEAMAAIQYDQVPFTAAASYTMLEYLDREAKDRTGVGPGVSGLDPQTLQNANTGVVSAIVDTARAKVEMYARNFAETGMRSLAIHMYELTKKHQDRARTIRLRNQWVEVDPSSWGERYDVTINVGLGRGSKEQKMLMLENILQKQTAVIQNGGNDVLVTTQNIYNTLSDLTEAAGFINADRYWMNPENAIPAQPQPDMQAIVFQAQLQLENAKLELQREKLSVENAKIQAESAIKGDELALRALAQEQEAAREQAAAQIAAIQQKAEREENSLVQAAKIEQAQQDSILDNATRIQVAEINALSDRMKLDADQTNKAIERADVEADRVIDSMQTGGAIAQVTSAVEATRARQAESEAAVTESLQSVAQQLEAIRAEIASERERAQDERAKASSIRQMAFEQIRKSGSDEAKAMLAKMENLQ